MADSSLLASILSGQDPLSPQMLQAYQGSQLSNAAIDPAFGHNEGWGGALAKTIAGFRGGGMTQDAVNNVTQARIAAQPELARLLAGQDPYGALGANPDQFSPLARAALLNGATPESVAEARLKGANAGLAALNLSRYQTGAPGAVTGAAVGGAAGKIPVGPAASPAGSASAPATSGNYLRPPAAGTQAADAPVDLATIAALPAPLQGPAIAKLSGPQKAAVAAQIAKLRAQRQASAPPLNPPT